MTRTFLRIFALAALCFLPSCQSAEKAALTPIAPDAPPPTFAELMARGKNQINAAHEFYYSDRWKDLEQAAVAIKETGTYLTKLPQVNMTDAQKTKLAQLAKEFNEGADQLKAAAAAQDPNKTGSVFGRINETFRQLRTEQLIVAPTP
jgi:hypothetical protein